MKLKNKGNGEQRKGAEIERVINDPTISENDKYNLVKMRAN